MTGKNMKARYGDEVIMRIFRVEVETETGEIDETDGESGGHGERDDTGVADASFTLTGNMRLADGAPPKDGDLLEDFLLALDGNVAVPVVNKRYAVPYLKVLRFRITGETRGKIEFTMSAKNSGSFKRPGQA